MTKKICIPSGTRRWLCLGLLLLFSFVVVQAQDAASSGDSTKVEVIKKKSPVYPAEAIRDGIQGQVWLEVLISEKGDVEHIDVVSGDPVLVKAATDACKKWKFKPFIKDGKAVKASTKIPFDFYFSGKQMDEKGAADGSATLHTPAPSPDAANAPEPVPVTPGVIEGLLIHKIAPMYPFSARQKHIEGTVMLQAVIGKDGRIRDLKPLSGPKELIGAAVGAVQQWRYRPYILNGEPVEVRSQITVKFFLTR